MKKIKTLAMLSIAIMVGSAAVSVVAAPSKKAKTQTIGAQKAKEIALAHAGLTAADVKFEKAELEYDNNVAEYDVEFYSNNTEYEYEINAVSGAVIKSQKESKKAQSPANQGTANQPSTDQSTSQPPVNQGTNNQPSTDQNTNQPSADQNTANQVPTTQNEKITSAKAKEIALAHAGLTADDVRFERVELDYENGVAVYEVDFDTTNAEYEYEINAVSGAVVKSHKENKKVQSSVNQGTNNQPSAGQNTTNQSPTTEMITSAKAKEIALAHAGLNAANVSFEKAKLDTDDGVKVYEVEFHHNGMEYSYEINAVSGAIVDFEVDND